MKKIKVLMFALEFPPVNTTGCYRYLKFLKYLHQFDTEITLLVPTVSDLMTLYPNSNIDNTLLNQIPESVKIIEVPLSIRAIDLIIDAIPNSQIKHLIRLGDDNIAPKWRYNMGFSSPIQPWKVIIFNYNKI